MKVEKEIELCENVEKLAKKVGKVLEIEDVQEEFDGQYAHINKNKPFPDVTIKEHYNELTGRWYYTIILNFVSVGPIHEKVPRRTAFNFFNTHVDFEVVEGVGPLGDEDGLTAQWIVYDSNKDFQQFKNQFKAIFDFLHVLSIMMEDNEAIEARREKALTA